MDHIVDYQASPHFYYCTALVKMDNEKLPPDVGYYNYIRGIVMSKRNYTHIQEMLEPGKSQREIVEHFDLKDKYVVRELLKRERRKEVRASVRIESMQKGRPRKTALPKDVVIE